MKRRSGAIRRSTTALAAVIRLRPGHLWIARGEVSAVGCRVRRGAWCAGDDDARRHVDGNAG